MNTSADELWESRKSDGGYANHDIVVIGGSAGGLEALNKLVPNLPEDLPAAVFVVLHLAAGA